MLAFFVFFSFLFLSLLVTNTAFLPSQHYLLTRNQRLSFRLHSHRRSRPASPAQGQANFKRNARREIRQGKMARILEDELAEILRREQGAEALSIAQIDLNGDCSIAQVFVSVIGNAYDKRRALVWLSEREKKFQHAVHVGLRHMKRVPKMSFHLVDELVFFLEQTIDEIERERIEREAAGEDEDLDEVEDVDFDVVEEEEGEE